MGLIARTSCGLFLAAALVWGQGTTAQINGAVKDSTGLPVTGATVQVTQTATGLVRTATSGADGSYVFSNLPIGPYLLEITKSGFSKFVQSGILLQVDSSPTIDAVLKVGAVTEQVVVEADASLVETHSTGVGTVVDNQRVVEMPINGRNVTELIFLAGISTVGGTNGGTLNSNRNYPTVMISVAGGVANWTTYNWDGETHNDAYNSLNLPLPFPDALQEFKVESSALAAQYGQHASANVNVATKSGTNGFHGDAFEFLRNNALNSRDFFAPTRDTLKRNQFGGTVGGPIKRDKLFFFLGWQETILHTTPTSNIAYIPTPAILAGDFTTFAGPSCNNGKQFNLPASLGFVNNKISPALFSAPAVKIAGILPTSTADLCGKVTYGLPGGQTENMGVGRVDWQKSERHSLYIRPFGTNLDTPSTYDGKNSLTANSYAMNFRVYSLAIGDTYLIGSNLVSSFHLGANRSNAIKIPDKPGYSWEQFGVAAPYQPTPNPRFTISGGNGFAFETAAAVTTDHGGPNFNVGEDLSFVKGAHQVAFGGAYNHVILNYASGTNAGGTMTFNGITSGLGMSDFMLGDASTFVQGNYQNVLYDRQNYIGMYVQDSWKATGRLTVNYGVRWEPFFAFTNKFGYFDHFDPALFAQNVHSTLYPNAPAGLFFPGDPQWTPGGNSIAHNRYGTFLPRLGIVWDPFGTGKTTIRASVGTFTDRGALYSMSAMAQDSPYGTALSLTNVPLANPWATYPGGNPLPYVLTKTSIFPQFASYVTDDFNWKPTWVNQFNFAVQRQFGSDWLATINYVGNTVSHLITEGQINPAIFLGTARCTLPNGITYTTCSTTANTNFRRALYLQNPAQGQYYGEVSTTDDGGTASYNALYVQLQKRLRKGVTILSNYTWSHCISDLWNGNPGNNGASAVTPGNRRNDRGNCFPNDQRELFNLSVVAQTPRFASRPLRILASDWQVAPIVALKSAQFYTVTTGVDIALNGQGGQRANAVAGVSPYVSNHNACTNAPCIAWGNPASFVAPAAGALGTLSNYSLNGPGVFQLDLAFSRLFMLRERKTLQVRAEGFNLPNHVNPVAPAPSTNSPTSYTITKDISGTNGLQGSTGLPDGDYRVIQLALKFVF
ncbi:MAG TPA: TonB-dependent receptor [Bryobacteraceae bacterium]|jgi:hypothetical protein